MISLPNPTAQGAARSLAERAYDLFLAGLRDGTFQPGQRLLETALADQLGMSRTPVREAIKRLEAEGVVAHQHNRGLCVATYDAAQVSELYGMREALEGTAARLATLNGARPEIALLQRLVEDGPILTGPAAAEQNRRFHRVLHQAAHNRYLRRSLSNLAEALLLLGPTTLESSGRAAAALAEHRRIVAAIVAQDAAAAEAAARAHIAAAFEVRLTLIATQPD